MAKKIKVAKNEIKNSPVTLYWMAYNDDYSVVHYDETKPSERTETGLNLSTFVVKNQRDSVLSGLGITPGNGAGSKND